MNLQRYHAFTQHLVNFMQRDFRVIGLVALGSMAEQSHSPDNFSDHDFFIITTPEEQNDFRASNHWLPEQDHIVMHFQDTPHGGKVLYDYAHVMEYAVFDEQELKLARVNDFKVLVDKAHIASAMKQIQKASIPHFNPLREIDGFIINIMIGIARYRRGEYLSAHRFIHHFATGSLLNLFWHMLPESDLGQYDNLDPFRRFEQNSPYIAHHIQRAMRSDLTVAAQILVVLARRHLPQIMDDYPQAAMDVLHRYLLRNTDIQTLN